MVFLGVKMGIFDKFRKKVRPRAVVVGLDGVPYTLLKDLRDKGHIPNMAAIFDRGYFGQMSVCIPEISSVSWSSFMTGTQSGEHGIFGFMDLERGSYKMFFPNFTQLKAPTLWDDLVRHGKRSVVINMPATYPARQIDGVLISGFVAIDINKAVYPPTLVPKLNEIGYKIDIDTMKARQDYDFLFHDLNQTLSARERAVELLWELVDWDLLIVVITGTDRLMHFLWDAYEDKTHPYHRSFLEYFGKVDRFVGKIYDRFHALEASREKGTQFYMLSDHGCTKIETEVYLNRWLQEEGYLKFGNDNPESIQDIGPGSAAFALDPSRLYLNLKGKYPLGTIDLSDYERIRQELKDGMEKLTFANGNKVVKRVYFKEELYQGPHADRGPDLVILSNPGYDLKGKVNSKSVFDRTNLAGMHSQNDAFFYNSSGFPCKTIFDVKRIVLQALLNKNF
jgi:predicted AlkP superfamily phosphohydrolase/phosphomutase